MMRLHLHEPRTHWSYCEWLLCTQVAVIKGKPATLTGPGAQRPLWRTMSFFFTLHQQSAGQFPPCMQSMHCLYIETSSDRPDLIYFDLFRSIWLAVDRSASGKTLVFTPRVRELWTGTHWGYLFMPTSKAMITVPIHHNIKTVINLHYVYNFCNVLLK